MAAEGAAAAGLWFAGMCAQTEAKFVDVAGLADVERAVAGNGLVHAAEAHAAILAAEPRSLAAVRGVDLQPVPEPRQTKEKETETRTHEESARSASSARACGWLRWHGANLLQAKASEEVT